MLAGRAELDEQVRRRQAQAGGTYTDALDWVTEQHQAGLITPSASAGEGLGEPGLGSRDRSDLPDPEDSALFRYAASRRDQSADPGTGAEQPAGGGRRVGRSEALDERHAAIVRLASATGETYQQCVQRLGGMVD